MRGVRRLGATLATSVAVALLLAGCGGDPEPKVEPTPSSPITSPTQSETTKPMSAAEFVTEWVRASNEMQVTGDTAGYRNMSMECRPCLAAANHVDRVYGQGGNIETKGLQVNRTRFQGSESAKDVDLYGVSASVRIIKSDGRVTRLPGGVAHFLLSIERRGDSWVATDLGLYES